MALSVSQLVHALFVSTMKSRRDGMIMEQKLEIKLKPRRGDMLFLYHRLCGCKIGFRELQHAGRANNALRRIVDF